MSSILSEPETQARIARLSPEAREEAQRFYLRRWLSRRTAEAYAIRGQARRHTDPPNRNARAWHAD